MGFSPYVKSRLTHQWPWEYLFLICAALTFQDRAVFGMVVIVWSFISKIKARNDEKNLGAFHTLYGGFFRSSD